MRASTQKNIIRIVLVVILLILARILTPYNSEQFTWNYLPFTPVLFIVLQSSYKGKQDTFVDRILILVYSVAFSVLLFFILEGFQLQLVLPKLIPAFIGIVVAFPLLFINPLYKK